MMKYTSPQHGQFVGRSSEVVLLGWRKSANVPASGGSDPKNFLGG